MSEGFMIPPGRYKARAIEGALGETSGGKEQVAVLFEIVEGDYQGQQMTWYGYFHGADSSKAQKNAKRTLESLRHCGWKGDDLTDLSGLGANEVQIVVEQEEYEGKIRTKIAWVNKCGGLALNTPLTGDKAKAFAARMKGLALTVKPPEPAVAPAPGPYAPPSVMPGLTDEDIPF